MSLKAIKAALAAGGNEFPFELGVGLKNSFERPRGGARLTDGDILVLSQELDGKTVLTYIDPENVVGVSLFVEV